MAKKMRLRTGSKVKIKIAGDRAIIFENIIVRVKPEFKNHVHLDTDEGNAAGINKTAFGEVIFK
jgi:putative phosphotransacetylase